MEGPVAFVDFAHMQGETKKLFESPQLMNNIGSVYYDEWKETPEEYATDVIPSDAYDALLYFQEVHAFRWVR